MKFQTTLTTATGYIFRNAFATIEEARKFLHTAIDCLQPGETIKLELI